MIPLGGGALAAAVPPLVAAPLVGPPLVVDEVDDDVDDPGLVLTTALSRLAASAWRLARLRAARRCFDSWRLSGTVDNGRAAEAPAATRGRPVAGCHRVVMVKGTGTGGKADTP